MSGCVGCGPITEARCTTLHHYHSERAKIIKIRQDVQRRELLRHRMKESAERTERVLEKKKSENAARILKGMARDDKIHHNKQRLWEADQNRRRQLATSLLTKEISVHMRQKAIKEFNDANTREKKAMAWLNRKYEASKNQAEKEATIQAAAKADLKQRASERQAMVEKHRLEFPLQIAAKKYTAARQLRLVRKFALIWLKKTRERVLKRELQDQDDVHTSLWIGREGRSNPMEEAQKDLMEMEHGLKAILTVMHKERKQAVAEQYSHELHRNSRAVISETGGSVEADKKPLISFTRRSSVAPISPILSAASTK